MIYSVWVVRITDKYEEMMKTQPGQTWIMSGKSREACMIGCKGNSGLIAKELEEW